MLKTRSDALLVWQVNSVSGGGGSVVITNSSNLFITNTSLTVLVQNSAGWIVSVANTSNVSGIQYTVDSALGATPTGTLAIFRHTNTLNNLSTAIGDAELAHVDIQGNLWTSMGTRLDQTNDAVTIYANTVANGSGTALIPLVDTAGKLQISVIDFPARTYNKTTGGNLISLQSVGSTLVVVGSAVDVSTSGSSRLSGLIYARFGRLSPTAAGAGVNIRLEASFSQTLNNSWFPFAIFTTSFAAAADEAVVGTVNAGATIIPIASSTGFSAGDIGYVANLTASLSEWVRIKAVAANSTLTIEDALLNAQSSSTVYDSAEIYSPVAIPDGALRIRAVADGSLFTQSYAVQVQYSLINSMVNV